MGVHLANGRWGDLARSVLTNLGGAAGGVLLGSLGGETGLVTAVELVPLVQVAMGIGREAVEER